MHAECKNCIYYTLDKNKEKEPVYEYKCRLGEEYFPDSAHICNFFVASVVK